MRKTLMGALGAVAAAGLIAGTAGAARIAGQTPTPQQIEAGKAVYAKNKCQQCHSIAGVGSKMSPLDGVGSKLKPEEIREWIVSPTPLIAKIKPKPKVSMKPYKLAEEDLNALVAYLSSLVKK